MKAKHTPGPWYFEQDGDGPKRYWDKYIVAPGGAGRVCTIDTPHASGPEEVKANSSLIAAAPELLEALRKSLIRLEFYCGLLQRDTLERRHDGLPQSVEVEFCCQQISANRAAIAKAGGEA